MTLFPYTTLFRSSVYGGSSSSATAKRNSVEISSGEVGRGVTGGGGKQEAEENKVNISNANIKGSVYGGWSSSATARRNSVEISSGEVGLGVTGGTGEQGAEENKVNISNANITGNVIGGSSDETARRNSVEISSGEVGGGVTGGNGKQEAEENKVNISNANITGTVSGGTSSSATAIGNSVNISFGVVDGEVIGGEGKEKATNNSVKIIGGDIRNNVYGGYSHTGEATDNEVYIGGNPIFFEGSIIYGGYVEGEGEGEKKRGNVLKLNAKGIRVLGIRNFGEYEFYNPGKDKEMVTIGEELDLEGTEVRIKELDKEEGLKVGDKYVLIRSSIGIKGLERKKVGGRRIQEILAVYECIMEIEGKELVAKIEGIEINPKSKGIGESIIESMDIVGGSIIRVGEMGERKRGKGEIEGFIVGRGVERGDRGIRVVGGVVKKIEKKGMNMGGYVEYGEGKYKTKTEVEEGEVRVRGGVEYVGMGMMGEIEIKEGIYCGMGIRVGRYGSEGISEDMGIGEREGEEIRYERDGKYVGGSIGGRYRVGEIVKKVEIQIRGEVELSYMSEEGMKISTKDKVEYGGIGRGEVRIGVRGGYKMKKGGNAYIGTGYEYEKMGEVRGKMGSLEMPSSQEEGGRMIGEIGMEVEIGGIGIRCGCEGYVGERGGIEGMLNVRYKI
jgi:hypothetical protein